MPSAAVLVRMADTASCLQVVQRLGSQEAINTSHLPFPRAAGWLAAANWPGAANGESASAFWHKRFLSEVPEELVLLVFSELKELEMRVRGCHCCLQMPIPGRVLKAAACQEKQKRCCLVLGAACSCLELLFLPAGEVCDSACR